MGQLSRDVSRQDGRQSSVRVHRAAELVEGEVSSGLGHSPKKRAEFDDGFRPARDSAGPFELGESGGVTAEEPFSPDAEWG